MLKSLNKCALPSLFVASYFLLTSCKNQDAKQYNFRAEKGWFFAKDQVALIFLPWSQFGIKEKSNLNLDQATSADSESILNPRIVEETSFCSYYLSGKSAEPRDFNFLNVTEAEQFSPQAFTPADMFGHLLNEERTKKNPNLKELALFWATGANGLSGDFLAENKGKIEGTVIASTVFAATAAVGCVIFSPNIKCITWLKNVSSFLIPHAKNLADAAVTAKIPQGIVKAKKFGGFVKVLKFGLTFGAAPISWIAAIDNDNDIDETSDKEASEVLASKLEDPGVQQRAEQKLSLLMENSAKKLEVLRWDDLQVLTQISFAPPEAQGLRCSKPSELEKRKADVAKYLEVTKGWGKDLN